MSFRFEIAIGPKDFFGRSYLSCFLEYLKNLKCIVKSMEMTMSRPHTFRQ